MKILFLDLENVVHPRHIFHPGKRGKFGRAAGFCSDLAYILVFGYMWLGEKPKAVYMTKKQMKEDPVTDTHILMQAKAIMEQADVLVTWYGKGHDFPFLVSRLARIGEYLDTEIKHIDLYDIAKKKLRLSSNRLDAVATFFGVENKTKVSHALWPATWAGDHKALLEMADYCKQDVLVLSQVYEKMLGLGLPLPDLAAHSKKQICPSCGGSKLHGNGYRVTKTRRYKRLRCADCGAHHKGDKVDG